MGDPGVLGPAAGQNPPPRVSRSWNWDDIFVALIALFGIGGAVFLPLRSNIPPITVSFLLATGLAALTYRYLGGIQGASFTVGTLKLGGALAALVGIALLINHAMVSEGPRYQAWQVTGQVVGDSGNPIEPLDPSSDISISPSVISTYPGGKFTITIHSEPNANGDPTFPQLTLSHVGYGTHPIDLNPGAQNDIKIIRDRQQIKLNQITLKPSAASATPYQSPKQASLKLVPYSAETAPLNAEASK